MAARSVRLPDIGEGVAEAEVTAWHVKVGDLVREDQPLADVMTDKATVEIPAPVTGKVVALGAELAVRRVDEDHPSAHLIDGRAGMGC